MKWCPICKADTEQSFVEKCGDYILHHCKECDVVFSWPLKGPGPEWYEKDAHYVMRDLIYTKPIWYHHQFLTNGKVYGEGELLDVGCSTGVFLKEAQKLGYKVTGIDINREHIEHTKGQLGINSVYSMDLQTFADTYPDRRFDVITLFEVLEHVDDPTGLIDLIRERLKPGGCFALSVPNRNRLVGIRAYEGDYPPHHFTRWSASALRGFLEKKDFEVIKLVVKEFDTGDLAQFICGKLSFGVASKAALRDKASGDMSWTRQMVSLGKVRDFLIHRAVLPLSPFIRLLKAQGYGLYCLARLR